MRLPDFVKLGVVGRLRWYGYWWVGLGFCGARHGLLSSRVMDVTASFAPRQSLCLDFHGLHFDSCATCTLVLVMDSED